MFRIEIETQIEASPERCFDLARDVGVHCQTAAFTEERAVPPGRTSGLLELGDLVTFEAVHLGVRQRLTAEIVELKRPFRFVDEQVRGTFLWLRHVHTFAAQGSGTLMTDVLEWQSPLGFLGNIADRLFVGRHMKRFVTRKQEELKQMAEAAAPEAS